MKKAGLLTGLFLAVLWATAFADLPNVPADGAGIKWSTLKQCVRIEQTADGPREVPVTWDPWGDGYIAYGYEVDLERPVIINDEEVTTIKVWIFPLVYWPPSHLSWCHGHTFDRTSWNPGGVAVPAILAAGWDEFDWSGSMAEGEIIVYFEANGSVAHSATSNGDGTLTSKNGSLELEESTTKEELDRLYLSEGVNTKCYRDRPDSQNSGDQEGSDQDSGGDGDGGNSSSESDNSSGSGGGP